MIAEGLQGAVTGSEDVQVTHMLNADDLTLLANAADALQIMLDRLQVVVYTRSKHHQQGNIRSRGCPFQLNVRCSGAHFFISRGLVFVPWHDFSPDTNMIASSEHAATPTWH